jgi:hypothetical protein
VDTLTEKMGDIFGKLGQAFLIAGYLPSALFILAHQLFLFPQWLGKTVALFQTPVPEEGAGAVWRWTYLIDQSVTALLLPLLLGVLLMVLNTLIIKLYEGAYRWQRGFLLRPWQRHNQRRAEELYGKLVRLKDSYTDTLANLASLPKGTDSLPLKQKRASIAWEMQRAHDEIAERSPVQQLPRRASMVKPTALGNAFAVIEEYPYERYGMDGVLFWPRLRPLLDESYATALVNAKMILDLLLNLSLLALIFGLETIIIGSVRSQPDWKLVGVGIGAWILSYFCYRGGVSTVYSLGDTICLCFDYFRGHVLEQLGLSQPGDIEAEQAVWLQLGQFLRRGEGFYYPKATSEAAQVETQGEKAPSPGSRILNAIRRLIA